MSTLILLLHIWLAWLRAGACGSPCVGRLWRESQDGRLGVFAACRLREGEVVERCYCLTLPDSDLPEGSSQLRRWLLRPGPGAPGARPPLLFPLGWGLLYNEPPAGGGANLIWEHEEVHDATGSPRSYAVLRAAVDVEGGAELCLPRRGRVVGYRRSAADPPLRDVIGQALARLESMEEVTLQVRPEVPEPGERAADLEGGALRSPSCSTIEMRSSPVHGNGIFAKRRLAEGEVVEITPNLFLLEQEAGHAFKDYQYSAGSVGRMLSKIALGFGSIYNHGNTPNVHYRKVVSSRCPLAQRYCTCYIARRDIEEGEELLVSYGDSWWESRGIGRDSGARPQLLLPPPSPPTATRALPTPSRQVGLPDAFSGRWLQRARLRGSHLGFALGSKLRGFPA